MPTTGLTLTTWLTLLIGLGVLLAGRRLFWLFVAATGFVAGLRVGTVALGGQEQWIMIAVAVALGILGALLAVFVQWIAIGLAGFVAGAYASLVVAEVLGVASGGWTWVIAAVGGLVAAALLLWLWDAVLVLLSALVGAGMLASLAHLGSFGTALLFLGLFVVGVAVQTSIFRPARRPSRA